MLSCRMDPQNFDRYCRSCNRCNSESKGIYLFQEDLSASEWLVRELKTLVRERTPYSCADPEVYKNPDIRVLDKDGRLVCRIEAKVLDGKPFMKVHDLLKDSGLYPKETIVVDLPKLNHYIDVGGRMGSSPPTWSGIWGVPAMMWVESQSFRTWRFSIKSCRSRETSGVSSGAAGTGTWWMDGSLELHRSIIFPSPSAGRLRSCGD